MQFISSGYNYLFPSNTSTNKPNRCCSSGLAKKIGAIFFATMLIATPALALTAQNRREATCIGTSCTVDLPEERTSFPKSWETFWLNEAVITEKGDCGCFLKKDSPTLSACEEICTIAKNQIQRGGIQQQVYTEQAFRYKGTKVTVKVNKQAQEQAILLGLNPKIKENYKNMLDKLSSEFIDNPSFFEKDPSSILDFIKGLHETLFDGIGAQVAINDKDIRPGKWRIKNSIVSRDDTMKLDLASLVQKLISQGASKKDITLFEQSFTLVQKGRTPLSLPQKVRTLWKKLFLLPPQPKDLDNELQTFAATFKEMALSGMDPVALAAWTHCAFVRIHPFGDGNGRVARALMNAILIRGGYSPIHIVDDAAYSLALQEDENTPGAFTSYLRHLLPKSINF